MRFKRAGERRTADLPIGAEQRHALCDRRQQPLRWFSLFRDADESAVIEAIGNATVIDLMPDDVLLRPGDLNDTVYLVLSGGLAAYLDSSGKPGDAIAIPAGECLGELSAIDGKPVSALVKASVPSRVLPLTQDLFWIRLMAVPGVARNLMVLLAARMRRNSEVMLEGQRRQIELEYLRQELDVARQLQLGMLPLRKPMFPERKDVDIAGLMEPASAVGGDLFDAFFVAPQRLFLCVGDVSGHGIPAAMFMARAVSLMRIAAFSIQQPAELLERVNDQLCVGNDANMFVTLFCGMLDIETGLLTYANAGHLPPIVARCGHCEPLPLPKGTVIGVLPGIRYRSLETVLLSGELLLCFTDGVTEAQTPAGEEFTEPALARLVEAHAALPLDDLLAAVRAEVGRFTGTAELADDCTLLAVRRRTA